MKKHYLLIVIVFATTGLSALHAQDTAPFSRMNLALRLSTMGAGLELATPLSAHINARAGADMLPFSSGYSNYSLESNAADLEPAFGYVPEYRAKVKIQMMHGHLLADIYPSARGIFHITAGAFVGTSRIRIQGTMVDAGNRPATLQPDYEWPVVNVDGYDVTTDGGRANLDLTLGNAVKPYVGIGLGRAVTQKGFGVKFELGVLYQGDYTMKQDGQTLNLNNTDGTDENARIIGDYLKWIEWWPMLNLQFSFRVR
jgi:opacity protein-like surface antigen